MVKSYATNKQMVSRALFKCDYRELSAEDKETVRKEVAKACFINKKSYFKKKRYY